MVRQMFPFSSNGLMKEICPYSDIVLFVGIVVNTLAVTMVMIYFALSSMVLSVKHRLKEF